MPTANVVVNYKASETGKKLNGKEARELSRCMYGCDKWWVLLEKA